MEPYWQESQKSFWPFSIRLSETLAVKVIILDNKENIDYRVRQNTNNIVILPKKWSRFEIVAYSVEIPSTYLLLRGWVTISVQHKFLEKKHAIRNMISLVEVFKIEICLSDDLIVGVKSLSVEPFPRLGK